jgi:thymidylate synthase
MLAGRRDLASLAHYNSRMSKYSDDGTVLHGAYGWRWRRRFYCDQVDAAVRTLLDCPTSRRVVIAMWDPAERVSGDTPERGDLEMVANDGADVPCNTHLYFDVQDGRLNMTVCNRSNDLVWGMLGANYVHFSILHEYVANAVSLPLGILTTGSRRNGWPRRPLTLL